VNCYRRVLCRRNPVLLETLEQPVDRLATDADHHGQVLLGQAQIDDHTLLGLAAVAICKPPQFLREPVKRTAIANNDQVLNRNAQVIADHSDKGRIVLVALADERIEPLLAQVKDHSLAYGECIVAIGTPVKGRSDANPGPRRGDEKEGGISRQGKAGQADLTRNEGNQPVPAIARRIDQGIINVSNAAKAKNAISQ